MKYDSSKGIKFFFTLIAVFFLCVDCNKNIDALANKAYLSVTNISPNAPSLDILFDGNKLNTAGQLPYDSTTGAPGNPYLIAVAGIHNFQLTSGSQPFVNGSIALLQLHHYSLFIYDSINNNTLKTLIVEDVLNNPSDTLSFVRVLNFSDTSLSISMTNATDTVRPVFARNITTSTNPTSFGYSHIKQGSYHINAAVDANTVLDLDSLSVSGGKIYTVFIKGPARSTSSNLLSKGIILHN